MSDFGGVRYVQADYTDAAANALYEKRGREEVLQFDIGVE
jgi:hypothetical protein